MGFRLRRDLHWCECDGRVVFLDVVADRYFCLPKATNDVFLSLAASNGDQANADGLRTLIDAGYLLETRSPPFVEPAPSIEKPSSDFPAHRTSRVSALVVARALAWEVRIAVALRFRSFEKVVAAAGRRARERQVRSYSHQTVAEVVGAATTISFLTRAHDRCLVRALAVHAICGMIGVATKLVIGVIAHPFAAHCWVQLGSNVLVGGYEQARLYTPILVVE